MTRAEALAEAKRRWGPDGAVSCHRSCGHADTNRIYRYVVGFIEVGGDDPGWVVKGQALRSYEAAFADASDREFKAHGESIARREGVALCRENDTARRAK